MLLYRTLLILLTPVIFIHLVVRSMRCGEWRYFSQRLGFGHQAAETGKLWLHCASVGEVRSALPLLEKLHSEDPELRVIVTSNTSTSRSILLQYGADWIEHHYCPIDWHLAVTRFLGNTRPRCCYLFETELWPNMIRASRRADIDVRIINGRISDKSMQRQGLLQKIYASAFTDIRSIHARSDADRDRFIALGADADSTSTAGDLKLARAMPMTHTDRRTERDYVLIVSTHEDEELQICRACRHMMSDHLFVIAPRHPERSANLSRQLQTEGFDTSLHSQTASVNEDTHIHIIDAIGLLDEWFPHATVVIMGGTFIDRGGHNLMEPLAFGRALLYGPSVHNFVEMNDIVRQQDAAMQVSGIGPLVDALQLWLQDESARLVYKHRARALSDSLSSTLDHYSELMMTQLQDAE